jgi:hypothetical protein
MPATFFPDWQAQAQFSATGPQPHILVETPQFKVIAGGLEAGQQIPCHPKPPLCITSSLAQAG